MNSFKDYIRSILEQRKNYLLKFFEDNLPKDSEYMDIILAYVFKMKNIFEIYNQKIFICDKTCRSCKRSCTKPLNHKKDCNCETSHICEIPCTKTDEC